MRPTSLQIFVEPFPIAPGRDGSERPGLGMSDSGAILHVILPQALRLSIPGWSNEYSIVLKDSAVTFALGVPEIMARTHFVATRTYQHLRFISWQDSFIWSSPTLESEVCEP